MVSEARRKWVNVPTQKKRKFRDTCRREQQVCVFCGSAIDYDADPHADESFSIDHERPRHLFPELISVVSNWRASHRGCNGLSGRVFNEGRCLVYRPFVGLG